MYLKLYTIIIVMAAIKPCLSQDTPAEISGIDYAAASPALSIDIDRMPGNFLKSLFAVYFSVLDGANNEQIDRAFKIEFSKYLKFIQDKIPNNNGNLVRVRIYSSQTGTKSIPSSFLFSSGLGVDPIDAYSEYLNTPSYQMPPISTGSLVDESYFLWVYKNNNRIEVSVIPREFKASLIARSNQVAMDKTKGSIYKYKPFKSAFTSYNEQALHWNDAFKKYESQLSSHQASIKIQSLHKEFTELKSERERLIQNYEYVKNKMKNNSKVLQTLSMLVTVSSNLSAVIEKYQKPALLYTNSNINYDKNELKQLQSNYSDDLKSIESSLSDNKRKLEKTNEELATTFKVPILH